ncbi:MAG: ABC transporter substrate-binding protein [Hyphomicrobiaceae bacterium]|nr:ABC transporter substrate-binding protein [Hyphomicrobiaceae bacterium]
MSTVGLTRPNRRVVLAGVASLTAGSLSMPFHVRAQEKPAPIRYATGGAIGPNEMETLIFLRWMQENVLQGYGRDYVLDMTFTRGTPEAGTLLAAGQADMGTLSFAVFANTLVKDAVPGGLTIVADSSQEGRPGFHATTFYVLANSPIKSVADLRGKRVGINAFGSAVDLIMRVALQKNGIDPRTDLEVVEVTFANQPAALRAGRIDCGVIILPFSAKEIPTGDFRPLFNSGDAFGTFNTIFHVARNEFLAANPKAVRSFLADYVRGLQWFYNPANRSKAIELAAELTKSDPRILESYFMTDRDYYRDPNGCVSKATIQPPIDAMFKGKIIAKPVDVSAHIDLSYLPNRCG